MKNKNILLIDINQNEIELNNLLQQWIVALGG